MHGEEEYVLPFGPQHPALAEPVLLRLKMNGERVLSAEASVGYMHRGIEKLIEGKTPEKGIMICERICGICPVSHSTCYTMAVEKAANEHTETKVEYLRMMLAELERIHSHLVCIGLQMHDMGFDTMFMFLWRERERILDIFEKITGGRIQHSSNRIGSVNFDILGMENSLLESLGILTEKIVKYREEYISNEVVRERTAGVGVITKDEAKRLNLVGPIARASGLSQDIRKREPYLRYNEFDYQPEVRDDGDCYTRTLVRIDEILKSTDLTQTIIQEMPKVVFVPPNTCKMVNDKCQGIQRIEAPRGELFYFVEIEANQIKRCRVRPPTYAYISALEPLLTNVNLGDVPMIVSSLDPCFACLDRVMVEDGNNKTVLNKKEFKKICGIHEH